MADIFQDVDEALKQERMAKFWKENGPFIIGAAILTIVLTAGVNGYRAWNTSQNQQNTALLLQAAESQNPVDALEKASADLRPGQRGVALLTAANEALDADDMDKAEELYQKLAMDTSVPDLIRDFAAIKLTSLMLDSEAHADPEAFYALLSPVTDKSKSPWQAHAHLQTALVAAHLEDNYERAVEAAQNAAAVENVEPSLKNRADALAHIYAQRLQNQTESTNGEKNE